MISSDNIVFEYDVLAHARIHSQEEIQNALVKIINEYIVELGIVRLDKVIVKKLDLFDTELGVARYKDYTIALASQIASHLADKSSRFYQSSLAILKHEMYHFLDFQNLLLNCTRKYIAKLTFEVLDDYKLWTEFFASFSTFEICEDEKLYRSFESVFNKSYSTNDEKKYYACRLLGYYLHDSHSEKCNELLQKYLSADNVEKTVASFASVLHSYPQYTTKQLKDIGLSINKIIVKKESPPIYTPVSNEERWKKYLQPYTKSKK